MIINPETFMGTWEEIKAEIVRTYGQYSYFLFISPVNGKEAAILPTKYALSWFHGAEEIDLRRITVY